MNERGSVHVFVPLVLAIKVGLHFDPNTAAALLLLLQKTTH